MAVVRWAAAAPIQPLSWELPYATGVALKNKNKNLNVRSETIKLQEKNVHFLTLVLTMIFFFLPSMSHRSSPARDETHARAVTPATAVATPNP